MLKIENIGEMLTGDHLYDITINGETLGKFTHRRSDGVAKLLLVAAKAVENKTANDRVDQSVHYKDGTCANNFVSDIPESLKEV